MLGASDWLMKTKQPIRSQQGVSFHFQNKKSMKAHDPLGVFLPEIKADEIGETFVDDLFEISLCASLNMRK